MRFGSNDSLLFTLTGSPVAVHICGYTTEKITPDGEIPPDGEITTDGEIPPDGEIPLDGKTTLDTEPNE
jgi:hypothetical protein